jgi:hypothetical protein
MKLDRSTIVDYLKKGQEIDKCDYNPKIASSEAHFKVGKESGKPIICLTNNMTIENARDCSRKSIDLFGVTIGWSAICAVCRGVHKHTKGYIFKYMQDLTQEELIKYNLINNLEVANF